MTDLQAAYVASADRVADLVRDLDASALAAPVPACPGWSVHDVVAHLAGVAADVNADRLEGAGGDEWSAAHVDARRGVAIGDVLAEWSREQPSIVAAVGAGAV